MDPVLRGPGRTQYGGRHQRDGKPSVVRNRRIGGQRRVRPGKPRSIWLGTDEGARILVGDPARGAAEQRPRPQLIDQSGQAVRHRKPIPKRRYSSAARGVEVSENGCEYRPQLLWMNKGACCSNDCSYQCQQGKPRVTYARPERGASRHTPLAAAGGRRP